MNSKTSKIETEYKQNDKEMHYKRFVLKTHREQNGYSKTAVVEDKIREEELRKEYNETVIRLRKADNALKEKKLDNPKLIGVLQMILALENSFRWIDETENLEKKGQFRKKSKKSLVWKSKKSSPDIHPSITIKIGSKKSKSYT